MQCPRDQLGIDLICCEKHKAEQQNELKATGMSPETIELDKTLGDLLECVAESNVSHEKATDEKKTNDEKEKSTVKRK